jgi:chromosome segregation ATPase
MRKELRQRREQHLQLTRMGVGFTQRCERLAKEYGVSVNAIEKDDGRMDQWVNEVATTASFEQRTGFLMYQHRSQTESFEQLASTARKERKAAEGRVKELQEEMKRLQRLNPDDVGMTATEYSAKLSTVGNRLGQAKQDIIKWTREERHQRTQVSEQVYDEIEMRQSFGEIDKAPDQADIRVEGEMDHRISEAKVYAGVDLNSMPGIEHAQLVGASPDQVGLEDGSSIEVSNPDAEAEPEPGPDGAAGSSGNEAE